MRAGGDRLHDVGAAAERAVDDDFRAVADRLDDLQQHVERAAAVIELTPAVVGDVNPFHAMLDRDARVLRGGDALEGERDVELPLDALDRMPVEGGLERTAGRALA